MAGIITLPGGPYLSNGRPNTKRSDPGDMTQLAEPVGARTRSLVAACPYAGELGQVSGLRDPGRQWDIRFERVGLANVWKFPPRGNPTTAVPARWNGTEWVGGSEHQHGRATDLGGTARAMNWMRAHREAYGLALTVTNEGWHLEANRRDVLTGRVHDRPTAKIITATSARRPLRKGDRGPEVEFLQRMLRQTKRFTGLPLTPVSGVFDERLELAVLRFQRWHNRFLDAFGDRHRVIPRLDDDAVVGPATSEAILAWVTA
jgi:hypothetical protein